MSRSEVVGPVVRPYTVTLFGSGDPTPEGQALAEELGEEVARRGWLLRNGGYGGTMAAAARGARAAGGKVTGVTCSAFGRGGANEYVTDVLETGDLFGRLAGLIRDADAFGAFPGGTGTLTEVFITWELMAKGLLTPRPLCLIGREWAPWWELFQREAPLARRLGFLSRAMDASEAVRNLAPTGGWAGAGAGGRWEGGLPRTELGSRGGVE